MAHYLTNNEKFHIFSKSPVLSSMAVSQAVNKSGHTVSTNDVWADDVPWFTEVADEAGAITRAANARYNDLILWGSDIYVRKGDKTNGASTGTTFAELWEKHTDLTEARAYALGSVTTQTPTNIVTKTVELKNASDKVVLKYHVGKQIDLLTTDNNANVASTWAARMFIDGKVVDQFVSPTDKVFAGNPSTGYTTLVYTATSVGNNYGFVTEGEADGDFVNNAFAGIVQFNTSRNDTHKFAASVFEYVGDKLDSTVAKLSAAVFGSGGGSPDDQPTDLVTQVNQNTAAITTLNGDVNTSGSIAQKINSAINGLGEVAVKSDITITDIKVQKGSEEPESLTITNKSVTIEIPEVPAAEVSDEGVVTTDGFTKTADVTNLAKAAINAAITSTDGAITGAIDGAISDATLTSGDNAIESATGDAATKLVTAEQVKEYVTENAQVTVTVGETEQATTNLELAGSTGSDVTITATPDTENGYKVTFGATIDKATVTDGVIDAATGNGDKVISATAAKSVAEKAIETALADTAENSLGAAIASKVADVTVDDTSIVDTESKVAKLNTTKTTAITADSESTSTKLATEASVAKTAKTLDNKIESKVSSVTGPTEGHVTVTTDPTTKVVTISVSDIASAETLGQVKSTAESAIQTVKVNSSPLTATDNAVDITAIVGVDETATNGIKVVKTSDNKVKVDVTPAAYTPGTGGNSWVFGYNFARGNDVASAISEAVGNITIPSVTTSEGAQAVGVTASGHKVSVATADYTPASSGVDASWADKGHLITGSTVETFVNAKTTKVLEEAKAYSDGLHSTNLVYIVLGDDETLPEPSPDTVGKIYLVKEGNTANDESNIDALSGSYVEYMTRKVSETEYTWEKIGTTDADLSAYAKKADLNVAETTANGLTYSQTNGVVSVSVDAATTSKVGTVQLTDGYTATDDSKAATGKSIAAAIEALDASNVGSGAVKVSQADGIVTSVTVDTETLVENGAIKTEVTNTNALIKAQDALAAIQLAKPENYISTVSDGETDAEGNHVNVTTGETNLVIKDGRENVYPNDLWGTTVSMVDNTITVQGGPIDGTAWGPKNGYNTKGSVSVGERAYPTGSNPITKVENNMVYNETAEVANIKTNELINGSWMFSETSLTSFSGDLSNLVNGNGMFSRASLTSFSGDLSSLVNGSSMFPATSLTSFSGDLSSLVNGLHMFSYTSLASFSGDLSSLINGDTMFRNTSLTSFSSDLSSLVNGSDMFSETSLTSFSSDLSSLVEGYGMFARTPLTSFSGDLSSLVNGSNMFHSTPLTSFSGDLSSLVNGNYMFYKTSLDVESVELICDVLPNYNTENGGKTLQTATWNTDGENKGKYTYSDWTSGNYYYPIIEITEDTKPMSQGNTDGIDRSFGTDFISASNVKSIRITWEDISVLNENDRTAITKLFTDTASEKGWTFITNTELGETISPNAVIATDGTIQYYVFAKKDEATEDDATHIDATGKLWKFDTAEAIIGPNIKYWSMFATVEDALTEWELTPWTKPTEEEAEA